MLTERDICPLIKLMLVCDDVLGPAMRLNPLNEGPWKSLACSLTVNFTVKWSPMYTSSGACTVISCAYNAWHKNNNTYNIILFLILPIFIGVSVGAYLLFAGLLLKCLPFVVLHSLQHALGILFALFLRLCLLLFLLLLALLLLLLVLLVALLLLVLLLLVFVLLVALLLLLVLILLVVATALLLLLLLLSLLQQSAGIGEVVACVIVLRVQLQGLLVRFNSLLEALHALLLVIQSCLHHTVSGVV